MSASNNNELDENIQPKTPLQKSERRPWTENSPENSIKKVKLDNNEKQVIMSKEELQESVKILDSVYSANNDTNPKTIDTIIDSKANESSIFERDSSNKVAKIREIQEHFFSFEKKGLHNFIWKLNMSKHDLNKEFTRTYEIDYLNYSWNLDLKYFESADVENGSNQLKLNIVYNDKQDCNSDIKMNLEQNNNNEQANLINDINLESAESGKIPKNYDEGNISINDENVNPNIEKSKNEASEELSTNLLPTLDVFMEVNLIMLNNKNVQNEFKNKFKSYQSVKFLNLEKNNNLECEIPVDKKLLKQIPNDDEIIFIGEITINKNYSHLNDNERRLFGYIGIVNEAMTCYMNSMLQTLNILGSFKKAVFKIPCEKETYESSISLGLQRLFYDLMHETKPIRTDKLINSFGWSQEEIHVQHDVQEFNLKLSDAMEKQMKNTKVEGTFADLFQGKLMNYIECVDIEYKSNKEENFCDLSLTVKGCKNIYESLDKFTEVEIMDGDDKYEAEGHGKQAARKGIKFISFPNVMIVQLKRFEYDYRKNQMVKINDRFEFFPELDLSKYTVKPEDDNQLLYTLHSVVVHQGNASSGHYYSYIRPTANDDVWYKFNDENVRVADANEALENTYGGTINSYLVKQNGNIVEQTMPLDANAYILVYIRNSQRNEILSSVHEQDVPDYLITRFENEKKEEERRINERRRQKLNLNIHIISKETIMDHDELGIIKSLYEIYQKPNSSFLRNKNQRLLMNVPKKLTIDELIDFISNKSNIPREKIFLYDLNVIDVHYPRRNYFSLVKISSDDYSKTIEEIIYKSKSFIFYVYVDDVYKLLEKVERNIISSIEDREDKEQNQENQEFTINDDLKKTICIDLNNNRYSLKRNELVLPISSESQKSSDINADFDSNDKEILIEITDNSIQADINSNEVLLGEEHKHHQTAQANINDIETTLTCGITQMTDTDGNQLTQNPNDMTQTINTDEDKMQLETSPQASPNSTNELAPVSPKFLLIFFKFPYPQNPSDTSNSKLSQSSFKIKGIKLIDTNLIKNYTELKEHYSEYIMEIYNEIHQLDKSSNPNDYQIDLWSEISLLQLITENTSVNYTYNLINRRPNNCCVLIVGIQPVNKKSLHNDEISYKRSMANIIEKSCLNNYLSLFNTDMPIYVNNEERFLFCSNDDEETIQNKIYNILHSKNFIQQVIRNDTNYFTEDLEDITCEKFADKLKEENIVIINHYKSIIDDYFSLPNFINPKNNEIDFEIKYPVNYYPFELFDIDNNIIQRIQIFIPDDIQTSNELFNYLLEPLLKKNYPNHENEEFYLVFENPRTSIIYEIYLDKNNNFKDNARNIEKNAAYKFRIQAFSQNLIVKEKIKVFLTFIARDGRKICDPMVIFVDVSSTWKELKDTVMEKITHVREFKDSVLNLQIVKFYHCGVKSYTPVKGDIIHNSTNEESISEKSSMFMNLLVEVPSIHSCSKNMSLNI